MSNPPCERIAQLERVRKISASKNGLRVDLAIFLSDRFPPVEDTKTFTIYQKLGIELFATSEDADDFSRLRNHVHHRLDCRRTFDQTRLCSLCIKQRAPSSGTPRSIVVFSAPAAIREGWLDVQNRNAGLGSPARNESSSRTGFVSGGMRNVGRWERNR